MPVVVVTGARQTGKTTLDEVQREPGLLSAIKKAVDQERRTGQFLLTGSANLLLMQKVAESLAGRASYLTLRPMTRSEQQGRAEDCGRWDDLLASEEDAWIEQLRVHDATPEDWRTQAQRGGFPALQMSRQADRAVWFEGYARTYLERDLLQLSSVSSLPDFRRLMRATSLRVGQLLNQTELGRDIGLPQPTVHRHLNLLEASYLLVRLPPYAVNRTKRLIKSPKVYWGDVGLALHLAGAPEPSGAHFENLVLQHLLSWRDAQPSRAEILFWRTTSGDGVDFVIETDRQLLPIEVKMSARPRLSDTRSLRAFRAEYPETARAGLLLHTGEEVKWLTSDVLAAPWWAVC